MSHPLRVVAHLGDVVKDLLQGPIDLDAFFDTHGSDSCAPNTFFAGMMPPHEALRASSRLEAGAPSVRLSRPSRIPYASAHSAVEAAAVEARRRVRLKEGQ